MGNQMIKKFILKFLGLNTTREDLVRLQELLNEVHALAGFADEEYQKQRVLFEKIPTCTALWLLHIFSPHIIANTVLHTLCLRLITRKETLSGRHRYLNNILPWSFHCIKHLQILKQW